MKIRYISDIHLEFINPNKIEKYLKRIEPNKDDIYVCAGDIGDPYKYHYDIFMKYMSKNFKKVFVIAGNHEYYNNDKDINETDEYLDEYFKRYDNISYLNNSYEYYEGYCIIGTTLWSKITNPQYEINDVKRIRNFDYIEYNRLNKKCVKFLEETVNINTKCIIITHHMPSSSLINEKYRTPNMLPYSQWFYSNMDNFIEKNKDKILCWIYGHTHMPSEEMINDIQFICNPIGYPNENKDNNYNKSINI